MLGLHPHLAVRADAGIAPRTPGRLHQQAEQALGCAEVAGEQRTVRVRGGHEGDATEVVALGNHLRAHEHINLAAVDLGQLCFEFTFELGGVGVDACNAHRRTIGPAGVGEQLGQVLFELFRAAAHGTDVGAAAARARPGHPLGVAAVVAAQGAVDLVEDAVGAAVRALAFPVAFGAVQHRRVAAPVQEDHALLAPGHPFGDGRQQRGGEDGALGLVVHVHATHQGQRATVAHAAGHVQPHITPAFAGGTAVVPAFQRGCGRAQDNLGAFQPAAVDGQVARRVACAFLLLVAGVVLLVHHDQAQPGHGGEHRHTRAEHDPSRAAVCGQPALEALRVGHAAVDGHHGLGAETRGEARLQLRCEVDLRHHDQGLGVGFMFQQLLHTAQVDLGLAAARGAEQQEGAGLSLDLRHHRRLLGRQGWSGFLALSRLGRGGTLQAPRQLGAVEFAQLRGQGCQGNLAGRALVIAGGKVHQLAPRRAERRQCVQNGAHGTQAGSFHPAFGPCGLVPDDAQGLAPAQRYAHQGPW